MARQNPSSNGNAATGRRDFLAACAGIAALAGPGALRAVMPEAIGRARFLAARRHEQRHEAVLLDAGGRDLGVLGLPERGHSFAIDAAGARAVVFGRQPGFYAQAFTLPACRPDGLLPLPEGRHFFGHGTFSADATLLFATENDFEAGRGVLGIYDARPGNGWRRLGEFDTHGIGPHEVVLADAGTLCVANGGLLTHPDYGKTPLNLADMRPSLAWLEASNGRLLELVTLPRELFQLSIRHLAVDAGGAVWFACQHEGPASQQPPLLGRHRRGGAVELFSGPDKILRGLRNYLGSISIDVERGLVATSSPVGGSVAFWNAADGNCLGAVQVADGCGVAPLEEGTFLISDGTGAIIAAGPAAQPRALLRGSKDLAWDNHLRRA